MFPGRLSVNPSLWLSHCLKEKSTLKFNWRIGVLLTMVVGLGLYLLSRPPLPQSLAYHHFADRRLILGIPNFFDVLSNLPFLLVGGWGLKYTFDNPQQAAPWSWRVLFVGVLLVSAGSAYYHWAPTNATLVWDRLPMTIGFMGLFVAMLCEYIDPKLERYLLIPFVLLGFVSVFYWHLFDDLRLYAWVQAAPLLSILVLLLLFPAPFTHKHLLFFSFVSYILAKVTEHQDKIIYAKTQGMVSGHTIKHLLAGMGVFWLLWLLKKRTFPAK